MNGKARTVLGVVLALVVMAAIVQTQTEVTSPKAQVGFNIGDDYHLANYATGTPRSQRCQLVAYLVRTVFRPAEPFPRAPNDAVGIKRWQKKRTGYGVSFPHVCRRREQVLAKQLPPGRPPAKRLEVRAQHVHLPQMATEVHL